MAGAISLLAQVAPLDLQREDYRASAALAWIATGDFQRVAERAPDFLHADELAAFRALKIARRQTSYLLGRYTAKAALHACVGPAFVPTAINVAPGVFNQPVVHGLVATPPLGVSISHSERMVCALAYPEEHPMAIDVEEIDAERTHVMLTQIGDAEADRARAACTSPDLAATVVWSAKEALSKALRCGMTCPFEIFETIELEARDGYYAGRFKNFAQYKFHSWHRQTSVLTLVLPRKTELGFALPHTL